MRNSLELSPVQNWVRYYSFAPVPDYAPTSHRRSLSAGSSAQPALPPLGLDWR